MAAKQSERIKLWGIVQGVGFRPYVAKTAAAFQMKGQVLNIGGLVEITVTDTAERVSAFLHALIENKPAPSEIVHIKREPIEYQHFDAFTIIKSAGGDDETAMIPADLSICPSCLEELYDKNNPRYQHPFISCMVCGPRYTIIDKIPYDRENTSMAEFPMCDFCNGEYTELSDRRYHAQTISCHDCGPVLLWKGADGGTNLGTAAQTGKGAGRTIQGFTKQTGNAASQINSNYLEQSESLKAQAKPTAQQTETSDSQVNLDCMAQAGNTATQTKGTAQQTETSGSQANLDCMTQPGNAATQTVTIPNGCSAPINTIIPHAAPNDAALTDTPVSESAVADAAILDTAANILQNGGVLLFKSAGGYNSSQTHSTNNPLRLYAPSKIAKKSPLPSCSGILRRYEGSVWSMQSRKNFWCPRRAPSYYWNTGLAQIQLMRRTQASITSAKTQNTSQTKIRNAGQIKTQNASRTNRRSAA